MDKVKSIHENQYIISDNSTQYAPFYNIECGNYDVVLNKINKAILNEFSKLKITKKK